MKEEIFLEREGERETEYHVECMTGK